MMKIEELRQLLIRHEGLKLLPYTDTVGKITIGVGRNLADRGITRSEAINLLNNDIDIVTADLDRHLSWWRTLSDTRQLVLADMCFNLGITKLLAFTTTLALIRAGDFTTAASEMLNSAWASQVGHRAVEISDMMRSGVGLPPTSPTP